MEVVEVVKERGRVVLALPGSDVRIQVHRYNSRVWIWRVWRAFGPVRIDEGCASSRRSALAMAERCILAFGLSAHRERTPASPGNSPTAAPAPGGAGESLGGGGA